MRALSSILLLAALALAGCSAGTSDDPNTPPNADPNGAPQSLPPVNQNTATVSGSPSPSNGTTATSTSTSATATTTATPAAPAKSFAAHDEEASASDPRFPGLFVGGRLQGSGAQVTVEATANNVGERDYRVPDGCKAPWAEAMRGPNGQAVAHRQPAGTCPGSTLKDFPAHEFLSKALSWDGRLWDAAAGAYVAAPSGTYTWEVTFEVHDGSGSDQATLKLAFDVTVP
jgi:hypothetical protein